MKGAGHQGEQAQKAPRFSFLRPVFPASPAPFPSPASPGKFRCSFTWEAQCFPRRRLPWRSGPHPGSPGVLSPCIQFISKDFPGGSRVKTSHFQSSNAGDTGSIPGQGTGPLAMWHGQKRKKKSDFRGASFPCPEPHALPASPKGASDSFPQLLPPYSSKT